MKKKNKKKSKYLKYTKKILAKLAVFCWKILTNYTFLGIVSLFLSLFFLLASLNQAGILGAKVANLAERALGGGDKILPLSFLLAGFSFLFSLYKRKGIYIIFGFLVLVFSFCSFLGEKGGFFGKNFSLIFERLFGEILTKIIFLFFFFFSLFIFYLLLKREKKEKIQRPSLIKRILIPTFKTKEVPAPQKVLKVKEEPKEESKREDLNLLKIEYQPPPVEFLESDRGKPSPGDIKENTLLIKKTLENFNIEVEMGEVFIGPTVTQYTLKPAEGVKLSKITSLSNDLALALASHPIRIEAPIPGKSLVGIEIPNKVRTIVRLKNLIQLPEFKNSSSPLTFIVGRDVSGNPVFTDLTKTPHLLVAGSTGSGKTMLLNSLVLSFLYRNSPKILKLVLIDPKRVEFPIYQDIPHLFAPVISESEKVVKVLDWLVFEMERRFEILAREKVRDIGSFNLKILERKETPLPYIVLIIDELADIMAAKSREVENRIVRLAQLARAVGIHLVLATQRPSVEVLTGLIKANITSRIAFQVASQFDSRTILDTAGAERLLGRGDMLFISPESPKPKRIQGAFVSEKEVRKIVNWFREKELKPVFDPDLSATLKRVEEETKEGLFVEDDPLYEEAKKVVVQARRASASLLQRRLKIGYARAARLIDLLEKRGVIGPSQGSKPREVLIKEDEEWQKV
jgi:S-DNA-T family DNA segregation ATPase FtsK/SpoIIIE